MEGYKQNFLLPIKRKQTNQLESNVLLVVVLFGQPPATKGSDDAMSIQRANAQLLKSYQQEFGDNLVQYYHVNYGVNKFSRGAGNYDVIITMILCVYCSINDYVLLRLASSPPL